MISWGEEKERLLPELIKDKLDGEWCMGTEANDDDLDGIMDYLKIEGYKRFTDPEDEEYEQMRCKLLRITYTKPTPIVAEKFEITRYKIGLDEITRDCLHKTNTYCGTLFLCSILKISICLRFLGLSILCFILSFRMFIEGYKEFLLVLCFLPFNVNIVNNIVMYN